MLETIHAHESQGILFPTLAVVTIQEKTVKVTDTTTTKITKPHRRRSSGQVAPAAEDPFEIVASQTANNHSTNAIVEFLREQTTVVNEPAEPNTPAPDYVISPKEGALLSPPPPPPLDDRNSPENTPDARPLAYTASVDAIARVVTTLAHAPDSVALQDLSHAFDQAEIDSKVIKLVFEVADFEDDELVYAASLYTFVYIVGWSGMAFCSPGCCVV